MPLSLLLNWRVWVAVAFAVAQAGALWKCYKLGEEHTQLAFDTYVNQQAQNELIAEQTALDKKYAMQTANQKVSTNYESLKQATGVAVSALDADRLRLQSALAASGATCNTSASASTDATAKDYILDRCLSRYEEVAGDAQRLSDQVTGLQSYVTTVVIPSPQPSKGP